MMLYLTDNMNTVEECKLTSVCCVSNVFTIASTDEELDLREQGLEVRDVGHGELHKSRNTKRQYEPQSASYSMHNVTNAKATTAVL